MCNELNKKREQAYRASGFTLVELMVVIVILGLLAGAVALNLIGNLAKAKQGKARTDVKTLDGAVLQFKMDTGLYPGQLEDLVVRPADVENWMQGGYLKGMKSVPKDPWGYEYGYEVSSGVDDFPYYIYSLGADGAEGGEGEDADIYNVDVDADEGAGAF